MIIKKPKAILFDWDNTLVDSWPVIHAALHKTFEAMGHEPWSFDDVKNGRGGIHHSLRDSFPRIFGDEWEEAKQHYFSYFLADHLEKIEMIPNAEDVIKTISDANIYMAVVSNKTGKYLREEVEHLGLSSYFTKIIGANDADRDKPHPDPVYMALEGSGIFVDDSNIDDIWLVGDSMTDIETAINVKCKPVLFGDAVMDKNTLHKESGADILRYTSHTELHKIIKNFN